MFVGIRVGEIGQFKGRVLANGRKMKPAIQEAMVEVLGESVDVSRDAAPVDTGFLKGHIFGIIISQTACKMVSEAEYSAPVNFGHFTRSGSFVEANPYFSLGMHHFSENIARRVIEKLLVAGMRIL